MSQLKVDVQIEDKKFKQLISSLKNNFSVNIGVLGDGAAREGGSTNAEIGKSHEFGEVTTIGGKAQKLPERSFLRVPLANHLYKYLVESGIFQSKKFMKKMMDAKSMEPLADAMAITSERVVQDAFDSDGFGLWPPSKMSYKKNKQTLVESQQLRNSITSKVEKE